ncbi:MAG: hypothetical protein QOK11_1949 [Pseudonocardiales bacterium]|nr:hypothetical protein [Pseudonocardiales bacterium]
MTTMAHYVVMTADGLLLAEFHLDAEQEAFSYRADWNCNHVLDQVPPAEVYEWVDEPASHRRYLRLVDRVAMMHALTAAAAHTRGPAHDRV